MKTDPSAKLSKIRTSDSLLDMRVILVIILFSLLPTPINTIQSVCEKKKWKKIIYISIYILLEAIQLLLSQNNQKQNRIIPVPNRFNSNGILTI